MQKTDAVDLIRRPSLETRTFVCSACLSVLTLDRALPTGGVACTRCGAHIGVGDRVEFASVYERAAALVLDLLFLVVPFLALAIGSMLFDDAIARDEKGRTTDGAKLVLWIVTLVVLALYSWFCEAIGQSFGKRAMGLRVVRASTWRRPGMFVGLIRGLAKLLTVATFGLGYAAMLFDSERRTLHDRIAGTRVIER